MTFGTPGTAARKTGSVDKAGAGLRQNRRPSVLTLLDSRAKRGKKGLFPPKTGTVGSSRAQKPGRRYRRSPFPAQPGGSFTDGPRFPRDADVGRCCPPRSGNPPVASAKPR